MKNILNYNTDGLYTEIIWHNGIPYLCEGKTPEKLEIDIKEFTEELKRKQGGK